MHKLIGKRVKGHNNICGILTGVHGEKDEFAMIDNQETNYYLTAICEYTEEDESLEFIANIDWIKVQCDDPHYCEGVHQRVAVLLNSKDKNSVIRKLLEILEAFAIEDKFPYKKDMIKNVQTNMANKSNSWGHEYVNQEIK